MFIALAILGICVMIVKLGSGRRSMNIHMSGWHTFKFGSMSCHNNTRRHRWQFRADVALVLVSPVRVALVEVHPFLCASSVSGNSALCHYGK